MAAPWKSETIILLKYALKKLALKIFQNGGSYKTVAGNLGISRDKARTWKRLWQIGRFEDNIRGIRFPGDYSDEVKSPSTKVEGFPRW